MTSRAGRLAAIVLLGLAGRALAQAPSPAPNAAPPPPSVRALLERGRAQLKQSPPAALESLRRARALAPNSEEVLSVYAEAALANRQPLSALPALEALTRLCPTVASYRQRLGSALLGIGDAEGAIAFLEEADRLAPDQAATLLALGTALDRRGLPAEARPLLQRALSLVADDLETLAALAEAEAGLGQLDAARTHAQRAVTKAATSPAANRALGLVRLAEEKWAEARDALLLAVAPPWTPYDALARACEGLGDVAAAEKYRALSRQQAKDTDGRVREARRAIGLPSAGAQP